MNGESDIYKREINDIQINAEPRRVPLNKISKTPMVWTNIKHERLPNAKENFKFQSLQDEERKTRLKDEMDSRIISKE